MNPLADLFVCESCLAIIEPDGVRDQQERHGPYMVETISVTKCCNSGYHDLDGHQIINILGRIDDVIRGHRVMRGEKQIIRNNIERIQIVLEGVFEL